MDAVEVKTGYGALRGAAQDGANVFKGIPFAQARRFASPEPPQPWDGVRDALAFGPACPQGAGTRGQARQGMFGGLFGPGELAMDEDCLNLNIWTPGVDDGRRPVMVWIHGGAFTMGTGSSPSYDGSILSSKGDVVVVTINYRLGPLGFTYLPGVAAANAGLQDQVAALRWVQQEIEAFGGDPDKVTIFGESAGGKSVECLLAMPSAKGLFRRAIVQSTYAPPTDPAAAEQRARALCSELGVDPSDPAGLDRLQSVDVDDVLAANQRVQAAGMGRGGVAGALGGSVPVVDGEVLPQAPVDAIAAGAASGIPVMIGTTLDEMRLFMAMMQGTQLDDDALRSRLSAQIPGGHDNPELVAQAIDTYRRSLEARGAASGAMDIISAVSTDAMFRQHSIRLAEAQASRQADTFMYLFTWPSVAFDGRLGSCHALELPFVFGTLTGPLGQLAGDRPQARELATQMQDAWLSFAKTGVPAATGLPEWPRFEPGERRTMVLGEACKLESAPLEDERAFWAPLAG